MNKGTCKVAGCDREHYGSGYCDPHWRRWKRTGDPGTVEIRPYAIGVCGYEGCGRQHSAGGWCATHYAQSRRGVKMAPIQPRNGPTPAKDLQLRALYGMTPEQYEQRVAEQAGGCAICGGSNASGRRLHVDHDHTCCPGLGSCGKCIRGLLCSRCNTGIGQFRESPRILLAAIDYLQKYS